MALSDVLSAIRELVLDEPIPDGDAGGRAKALGDRFPRLDSGEIRDLAAIDPARLSIYTDLIYAGQRSTLQWIFPVTFAVIHRFRGRPCSDADQNLADFELTRDLQHRVPWRSSSTRQLAQNFQEYLAEFRPDLVAAWSGLNDLVDDERTDLEVFYAPDVPHSPTSSNDFQRILNVDVSALLELRLLRPEYVALRSYSHNPYALISAYRSEGVLADPLPGVDPVRLACGRHIDTLLPAWAVLSPAGEAMVRSAPPNATLAVNDLANAYLEALGSGMEMTEEERFVAFFGELQKCLLAGIFLRPE
jgi:hypothetical protein